MFTIFPKRLLPLAVPVALRILEPEVVCEGLNVFRAHRQTRLDGLRGKGLPLGIMSAACQFLRLAGGETTHSMKMEIGKHNIANAPVIETFPIVGRVSVGGKTSGRDNKGRRADFMDGMGGGRKIN